MRKFQDHIQNDLINPKIDSVQLELNTEMLAVLSKLWQPVLLYFSEKVFFFFL